jgi:hypothetical protein
MEQCDATDGAGDVREPIRNEDDLPYEIDEALLRFLLGMRS